MISLLIDTCTNNTVIGLVNNDQIIDQKIEINDKNLSTNFVPWVQELLDKNNIEPNSIDNIFIAVGPGSFTGIRVGVTFAKVFAWSLNKRVIPFSSLELLATSLDSNIIVPLIDARRDYVFAGIYDSKLNSLTDEKYIKLTDLSKQLEKYEKYDFVSLDKFDFSTILPNVNIKKIISKHINDEAVNPHSLNPVYLKKTEAEEKLLESK